MLQRFVLVAAWASVAILAYATLTHVGFVYSIYFKLSPFLMHMSVRTFGHFEHVIAFAKRVVFVWCVVLISAFALEYLQTLTPDRHGTLIDALEKIVGGAFGICAARAALYFWSRSRSP
jgi:hypothetical protein